MFIRKKIIIVAADMSLLESLKTTLWNYYDIQVIFADINHFENEKIIEVSNTWSPDMVIVDLMMPSKTGIKIICYVRQYTDCPTMLLTTWKSGKDRLRSLDVFSANGLSKPFPVYEVRKRLDEFITRRSRIFLAEGRLSM
jgi:DNA-binding response OmpR family regulator